MSEEKLSPWEQWKKNLGDTRPWDFLDPRTEYADSDTQSSRMSICDQCPELIPVIKQCKKCGCLMVGKVKLQAATCPLGKW